MDKVDQQANILKKRLVVAGKKVRERILRDMRGTSSFKLSFFNINIFYCLIKQGTFREVVK